MTRLRSIVTSAVVAALAISAMTGPVSAIDGKAKMVVVQGIPGAKTEVCISGNEIRHTLRYGQYVPVSLPAGTYRLALRVAATGNCKGALVAKKQLILDGTERLTVVSSYKHAQRALLVFDDTENLVTFDDMTFTTYGVIQHAARLGRLDLYVATPLNTGAAESVPTVPALRKGQQQGGPSEPGTLAIWLTKAGSSKPLVGPKLMRIREGYLNHQVAIGTHPFNARTVFFRTAIDA